MYELSAPPILTALFIALTLVVVALDILLVRRVAPADKASSWTARAILIALVWLGAHAGLAESGVLEGTTMPPPVMFYLAATMFIGVAVAFSPLGRRLSQAPLALLVGLQAFRLPLEMLLHALYGADVLPVQMTWSGYNFDVATGITAAGLGLLLWKGRAPTSLVWLWNLMGIALLITVVTLAILSTPMPFRQFHEGPAVVLPFNAPFNWIVNVHVWTALVGHLIIFRALLNPRSNAQP